MRIVLSGGGTGGHIYPILAVAAAMKDALNDAGGRVTLEQLYVGTAGGREAELVRRTGLPFQTISSGPIRGQSPLELTVNAIKIGKGWLESLKVLRDFSPHAVLSTGGYASFPLAIAAYHRSLPLVVCMPDVRPGWAIELLAKIASRVAVSTETARSRLPTGKTIVTGYPVRPQFYGLTSAEGRRRLKIDPEGQVLLVAGASQGAKTINLSIAENLSELLGICQIIHVSGYGDEEEMRNRCRNLPERLKRRYHLYGYLHDDLPWAMAASDLAVCRAGASVIGELPASGLPAVLVPYPHAGGHQRYNALYLERYGAAITLGNADLRRCLLPLVRTLLGDRDRLACMATASRQLARPNAARDIARLVLESVK